MEYDAKLKAELTNPKTNAFPATMPCSGMGLTKREWFAGQIMAAQSVNGGVARELAGFALLCADALIVALNGEVPK